MDLDREIALLFFIFDENQSWYLEENIQTYYNSSQPLIRNDDFVESNKMHGRTLSLNLYFFDYLL